VGGGCRRDPSKKQHLFGYRLHLLAPASAHDVSVAPELLEGHDDLVVLGDKGYLSAPLAKTLRQEQAVDVLTPPRRNALHPPPPGRVSLWNGLRQMVETVNAQLTEQFDLARHSTHTFGGLAARLETKLTAHTFSIALNWQLGKAAWLQINPLAFPISHMTLLYKDEYTNLHFPLFKSGSRRVILARSAVLSGAETFRMSPSNPDRRKA